ncbi:hypothetical protein B194_3410 [Serratia plymuthica A30]|nr:hypothetical protein B194_3410 [Serratia plymuthica A30]
MLTIIHAPNASVHEFIALIYFIFMVQSAETGAAKALKQTGDKDAFT